MGIVGYIRVSTDDQTLGAEAQEERIRAYCALYGLDVVEWVRDLGESGKSLNRPGMIRALELLRDGTATGLIVAKLDRLTRSTKDLGSMVECGWGIISVGEQLDTNTAAGRMMVHMLGVFAQFERETIVERTKAALDVKRQRGEKLGGRVPFGYRVEGRKLVPDEREQPVVVRAREMRAAGWSLMDIRATLGRVGRGGAMLAIGTISRVCR